MKTEIKKLPKSEIEIDFELTAEDFQKYFDRALEHLKGHVKLDGFRKGHVPTGMIEEKVGKENVLAEAGDLAVKATYPKFVEENNIEPIGDPQVEIKKIAKGNEFLFTVKVSVLPDIELPNYKEIVSHVKAKDIAIDEKEVDDAISYLQKSRAMFSPKEGGTEDKDFVELEYQNKDINNGKEIHDRFIVGEGGFLQDFESNILGMKAGEEKEFMAKFPENTPRADLAGKPASFKVKMLSVQKMELSPIDDEFAKQLGAFDTLVALKNNLRDGITLEKKESEKQRARGEMLEKISAKVKFDIPEKMVEFEKDQLFEDLKLQVSGKFNMTFENYLASVKKTEEEIKATYKLEAEKRIKNFLVLRALGMKESIEVTPEELMEDVQRLMKNYTKEQLSKIDIERLKEYSKGAVYNEKVFQKLETFAK